MNGEGRGVGVMIGMSSLRLCLRRVDQGGVGYCEGSRGETMTCVVPHYTELKRSMVPAQEITVCTWVGGLKF